MIDIQGTLSVCGNKSISRPSGACTDFGRQLDCCFGFLFKIKTNKNKLRRASYWMNSPTRGWPTQGPVAQISPPKTSSSSRTPPSNRPPPMPPAAPPHHSHLQTPGTAATPTPPTRASGTARRKLHPPLGGPPTTACVQTTYFGEGNMGQIRQLYG